MTMHDKDTHGLRRVPMTEPLYANAANPSLSLRM
eukprot:CAMPEP_0185173276 /NCGR_PEP_ID=MMETSP1139-20130426/23102_1 /TAXON_ID=298111 /ORGANISM="Pavlova sp., Strain CCMP459" /LENGTH=33 /DNA_ID= /DNA_START= /DNA_END= /DNA_ORIENTATION=